MFAFHLSTRLPNESPVTPGPEIDEKGASSTHHRPLRVLFAGGGTGGHLFPGLEVAREIVRARPGSSCVFLGTGRPAEARALTGTGFGAAVLPAARYPDRPAGLPRFALATLRALLAARRRVRALDPDVVIGLGGYASAAPVLAAAVARRPVFLLEQNAVPGRANRLLARIAREVFVPFAEASLHFSRATVRAIGNPVRRDVLARVEDAHERLGLDPSRRTLLVMGGSQGARGLNRAVLERADLLAARRDELQVVHLAGAEDAPIAERRYREVGLRARVVPYLAEMQVAYSAADLALARAGGTSIAELQCRGLPAVLVPFPGAAEDHQTRNAEAAARSGGAIVVSEADLARVGIARAVELVFDEPRRAGMAHAMRAVARPGAAREIVERILQAVDQGRDVGGIRHG